MNQRISLRRCQSHLRQMYIGQYRIRQDIDSHEHDFASTTRLRDRRSVRCDAPEQRNTAGTSPIARRPHNRHHDMQQNTQQGHYPDR
jgi:hypothetical protein